MTESAAYDIVVDDGVGLRRVQCKYCGGARAHILCSDEREYLIKQCLHGRRSITLRRAHLLEEVVKSG